jgi:hypothetical protein
LMQCRASIPRARCSLRYLMQCRVRKYPWQDAAWGYSGVLDAVQSPKVPRARCSLGYLMRCRVRKYLRVPLGAPNRIFTSSRSRHAVNRARLNTTIHKCIILKSVSFLFLLYFFFFSLFLFLPILPP